MRTLVLFSCLSGGVFAEKLATAPAAFAFHQRLPETKKPRPGLLEKFFHYVDGGDLHGYGAVDGSERKAENPLHTLTVRWQFHF